MTKFSITVILDTICPWCYIGYRRLQAAIAEHQAQQPNDSFAIKLQPFQLNPKAAKGQSSDKLASYEDKYGREQTQQIFRRVRSAAEGNGINFSFAGRIGNTLDSHRLLQLAQQHEKTSVATALIDEVFADYFEREQDITSHAILAQAAARAGMNEREVLDFLASDELVKEVEQQVRDNRDEDINGVPLFVLNDTFTVEGAQEPAAFLTLFARLKKREAAIL